MHTTDSANALASAIAALDTVVRPAGVPPTIWAPPTTDPAVVAGALAYLTADLWRRSNGEYEIRRGA